MIRLLPFLTLAMLIALAGCSGSQRSQLATCDSQAASQFPKPVPGQPLKAIQSCMDKAGYRFIGWNEGVVCDMASLIHGQANQGAAICFEPKNWLQLKLYRLEVPVRSQAAPAQD